MAAASITDNCKICYTRTEPTHRTQLFSVESEKVNLASRINKLLLIPVEKNTRLPHFICRSCKNKFLAVEARLESLRALARSSYEALAKCTTSEASVSNLKRPKDTAGGPGVSPNTVRVQPVAKRFASRQLFPKGMQYE